MTPEHVRISRRAALIQNYLGAGTRERFREAVEGRGSVENIPEPYRGWMLDPSSIPEDERATYVDSRGETVSREIPELL